MFDNNKKTSLSAFFKYKINSNRLKIAYSIFYRVEYYLIEDLKILFNIKMINFSLL